MKYNALIILIAISLNACSSSPKIIMKNCKALSDDFYECEELPQKNLREPRSR